MVLGDHGLARGAPLPFSHIPLAFYFIFFNLWFLSPPFLTPFQVPGWQQSQNPEPDLGKNIPLYILILKIIF
jgi:hypothetical protein